MEYMISLIPTKGSDYSLGVFAEEDARKMIGIMMQQTQFTIMVTPHEEEEDERW